MAAARARGTLEHEVLLCLAAAERPLTAADVQTEMVERFEFEVDTTLANERWHAEVADNLRATKAAQA